MAIQLLGQDNSTIAKIDPAFGAVRMVEQPPDVLTAISISATTGNATTVAANGQVFQLRNGSGSTLLVVNRIRLNVLLQTAFTTAQIMDYGLVFIRNWTADGSGGTTIALTGNEGKRNTNLQTPVAATARIATTAALTAGTQTADTIDLSQVIGWGGAVGTIIPFTEMFEPKYPIILRQNEGIAVRNKTLMGAAGVARISIGCDFFEVPNAYAA